MMHKLPNMDEEKIYLAELVKKRFELMYGGMHMAWATS
jgi:hypothetical protein